jgi:hypothetical protein
VTEQEWLACTEPEKMLKLLRGKGSDRKLRLFAYACCRRSWHLMTDNDRHAVEVAEHFSEGLATAKDRDAARYTGSQARPGRLPAPSRAAGSPTFASGWSSACHVVAHSAETVLDGQTQCGLIREICGNPLRPATIPTASKTPTTVALAQAAYDERDLPSGHLDPARLAVLADALEEAGCTDPDILGHLRGPGPHVRGCWAVDLLMGKS